MVLTQNILNIINFRKLYKFEKISKIYYENIYELNEPLKVQNFILKKKEIIKINYQY